VAPAPSSPGLSVADAVAPAPPSPDLSIVAVVPSPWSKKKGGDSQGR
jgi:hypothetical protein